jgi:hypothetical protein
MLKATMKLLPLLFLVLLTANSCKKKNDQKSKTQLITERDWRVSEFKEKVSPATSWDNLLDGEPACNLDDRYVFKTNNSYENNEGPTKCDSSDPQVIGTGTWALIDSETKFSLDGQSYTIIELTNDKFVIEFSLTNAGTTYTVQVAFVH